MLRSCAEFSADELRLLFGEGVGQTVGNCIGVSTDSRTVRTGELFVALSGEAFDGHKFVQNALQRGAAAAIIEQTRFCEFSTLPPLPLICVYNTLTALGELARFHRLRFDIPVVAIAGAAGKTSTKDLAAHILARKFSTLKTEKNYNNRIGVPLTLLQLASHHTAAVIEIGTNEPGEIAVLSRILSPTHGLITNIGKEHLEKLLDLDGVEREECELFEFLHTTGGTALVNLDDIRLAKFSQSVPNVCSFGLHAHAELHAEFDFDRMLHPKITLYTGNESAVATMQTFGQTAVYNAVAAAAAAYSLGMPLHEIAVGLETFAPPPANGYGRMVVEQRHTYTLINDCYNANPESVLSALKTLREFNATGRKIAALGDMRELGDSSAAEHDEILRQAADSADVVIAIGEEMSAAAKRIQESNIISSPKDEAANRIRDYLENGSILLIKGSRGIAMETIIEELKTGD